MPKMLVNEAPAGPAMDAAVAEVLGWENLHWEEVDRGPNHYAPEGWWGDGPNGECYLDRSYSTDIAAAWELAEKYRHGGFGVGWSESWGMPYCMMDDAYEYAETAPLAICRAFLKANGVEFVEVL
jgi:hypothetical protein